MKRKRLATILATPWKVRNYAEVIFWWPWLRLWFKLLGIRWGRGWLLYGWPIIQKHRGSCIEVGEFSCSPARGELRSRLGLSQNTSVTLFLGRIGAKKGLDLAIRAFTDVANRYRDAHFVVAGPDDDGSGRRALQLTHQLGLQDRVHFIGMVTGEDRLSALVDADLFILTSYSENFGMAAAEALAMGVPVLLSDQVGIARQVTKVRAGAVVQLDISHIAQIWSALLDNQIELKLMGLRGRKLVQEEYDADAVARKMLGVYRHIIQDWQVGQSQKR